MSEAGAGSDVANNLLRLQLHQKKGMHACMDDYIINGSKMWIAPGLQADWGNPHNKFVSQWILVA